MSISGRRFEILLPLRFNEGSPVPDALVAETLVELRRRFGAVSSDSSAAQDRTSQRKLHDAILPVIGIGRLRYEFQVKNQLSETHLALVRKHQTREWPPGPLPVLGHYTESDILRDQHPLERGCDGQQFMIGQLVSFLFCRCENVHTAVPELQDYGARDMRVSIEADRH